MVLINYAGREINAKIVYYGPGLSGKTTNLECIYASVPSNSRGKMVSMKTRQDRTLFFDFLPLELGEVHGFRTRFLLYTVPGQVFYNATRKLVLKGADAVVFVADSGLGKMDENLESLRNLEENLREQGLSLDTVPFVIQYNKRDLPQLYSLQELESTLNTRRVPSFEAAAASGQGVYETLHAVSKLLFQRLMNDLRPQQAGRAGAPAPQAPSPAPPGIATARPAGRGAPQPAAPRQSPVPAATGYAPARGAAPRVATGSAPEPAPRPGFIDPSVITMANPERTTVQGGASHELPEVELDEPSNFFGTQPTQHVQAPERRGEGGPGRHPVLDGPEGGGEGPASEYPSYGHVVDLAAGGRAPGAEPNEGFIKDPMRRRDEATPAGPRAAPAPSGPTATKRVAVVVSRAELQQAGAIRIFLDVRLEP
jgi:signal recognition particle receptor subunit beta